MQAALLSVATQKVKDWLTGSSSKLPSVRRYLVIASARFG